MRGVLAGAFVFACTCCGESSDSGGGAKAPDGAAGTNTGGAGGNAGTSVGGADADASVNDASTAGSAGVSGTGGIAVGGTAGVSGAGGTTPDAGVIDGSAGAPADAGVDSSTPQCVIASDCNDGYACNGIESCVAGSCVSGVYPCANPDPLQCSTSCTQGPTGAPKCEVAALDADGDGYGNAFCTKPGTDCDDTNATIFPGASEICDGIDGNCNAKDDFADLGANTNPGDFTTSVNGGATDVAFAPPSGYFGVLMEGPLRFALMGANALPASAVVNLSTPPGGADDIDLVWGGDSFGIVYASSQQALANPEIIFQRFSDAGVAMGSFVQVTMDPGLSLQPQLVRVGTEWIVVWVDDRDGGIRLYAKRLAADGTPLGSDQKVVIGGMTEEVHPRLALSGGNVGLIWTQRTPAQNESWVWFGIIDPITLTIATPQLIEHELPPNRLVQPVLAGDSAGFALAWTRDSIPNPASGSVRYARLDASGQVSCGPATLLADSQTRPWVDSIAATPAGVGIVGIRHKTLSYNVLFLQRVVGSTCTVAGPASNVETDNIFSTGIASSATHTALAWDRNYTKVRSWVLGANWCD